MDACISSDETDAYWLKVQQFEFFYELVQLLCWEDIVALLRAFPALIYGLRHNQAMVRMGARCRRNLRQVFRYHPGVELEDRMELWHWTVHSRDLRLPPHLIYDRPCDALRRVTVPTHDRPRHYMACKFLPSEAPEPFSGGLIVITDHPRVATIFAVDEEGFYPCVEDVCSYDSFRILVSPLGQTALLVSENRGEVMVLLFSEYKLNRIVSRVRTSGSHGQHWFLSEDEFLLTDANYDFYRYKISRDSVTLEKELVFAPEVSCNIFYNADVGKIAVPCGYKKMGMPHSLMRYACGRDFLVFEDRCGQHGWQHPTHSFQLVLEPGLDRDNRVFHCNFPRQAILELLVDQDGGELVYVVCMTLEDENDFYRLTRCLDARARRSSTCQLYFPGYQHCSLGIYTVDVADIPRGRNLIPLVPKFCVPSSLPGLLRDAPVSHDARYFRHFFLRDGHRHCAILTDLFVVVTFSPITLLLFPRAAVAGSPPLSLTFGSSFSHFDFSPRNRYFTCLPSALNDEAGSSLRLYTMCSHRNSDATDKKKKSTRYRRVNSLFIKSDFF